MRFCSGARYFSDALSLSLSTPMNAAVHLQLYLDNRTLVVDADGSTFCGEASENLNQPRISALFGDLDPKSHGGGVAGEKCDVGMAAECFAITSWEVLCRNKTGTISTKMAEFGSEKSSYLPEVRRCVPPSRKQRACRPSLSRIPAPSRARSYRERKEAVPSTQNANDAQT